ncbi:hypothetical protein ACNKHX_22895 [Shigella flexneri]
MSAPMSEQNLFEPIVRVRTTVSILTIRWIASLSPGAGEYRLSARSVRTAWLAGRRCVYRTWPTSSAGSQLEQALDWLVKESRRGLSVQRYKGLGGVKARNSCGKPRSTRKAVVCCALPFKDAIAADRFLFTTLMGDAVEPRRVTSLKRTP